MGSPPSPSACQSLRPLRTSVLALRALSLQNVGPEEIVAARHVALAAVCLCPSARLAAGASPERHFPYPVLGLAILSWFGTAQRHRLGVGSKYVMCGLPMSPGRFASSTRLPRPDIPSVCPYGGRGGLLLSQACRCTRAALRIARRTLGRDAAATSTCLFPDRVFPALQGMTGNDVSCNGILHSLSMSSRPLLRSQFVGVVFDCVGCEHRFCAVYLRFAEVVWRSVWHAFFRRSLLLAHWALLRSDSGRRKFRLHPCFARCLLTLQLFAQPTPSARRVVAVQERHLEAVVAHFATKRPASARIGRVLRRLGQRSFLSATPTGALAHGQCGRLLYSSRS